MLVGRKLYHMHGLTPSMVCNMHCGTGITRATAMRSARSVCNARVGDPLVVRASHVLRVRRVYDAHRTPVCTI